MIKPIAVLLTLTGILSATEAKAQHFFRRGNAQRYAASASPAPAATAASAPASRVYTYSYYSRSTLPARTYVGYGDNDFPFHGVPYGHTYDPWTWQYMAEPTAGLARYYDPPVK